MKKTEHDEFQVWCNAVEKKWLAENPKPSPLAWNPRIWVEQVTKHTEKWNSFITPMAENYWQERGYKVIWPDDDSDQIKLESI